jgi:hypothetical protein
MSYFFTSQKLIDSIKRRANIPDAQSMITDDEILEFANEELLLNLLPLVVTKHEDYLLVREYVPTESGVKKYQIPYRALGNKLREVAASDSILEKDLSDLAELTRVSIDDITNRNVGRSSSKRFYIENESIVLDSSDDNVGFNYIVFFYNMRPNMLVNSDRISIITSIDRTTGIIEVSSLPDNFSASSIVDFIRTKSPHRILDYDISLVDLNVANKYFQFDVDDIPANLEVGDRICLQNETDLINIPSELHPMLAQMVASRVLESIGDNENLQQADKKLAKMEKNTELLIANRVIGSPIKVRTRNGLLRGRNLSRFRR